MAKKLPPIVHSRTPLYHNENQKFYWNHCWYCGKELYRANAKLETVHKHNHFTRDHIIPVSQGGGRGVNTVPACYACNRKKKDHSIEHFRFIMYGKKGGLFYAEQEEARLKLAHKKGTIRYSLGVQLAALRPARPVFKPIVPRCYVGRELIYHTFVSRLLRKIFERTY